MKVTEIITEASLGTEPKRPARKGSRPSRGHKEEPRYKNGISREQEDKFHVNLDKLVHSTFGHSSDEVKEGWFDPIKKVDWNKRAKELFAQGMNEQQVQQQLIKEGCPPNQAPVYVQAGQMNEGHRVCKHCGNKHEVVLDEHGKASRELCLSSKPDDDLGASNLSSCKSQGLRARDGNKSHKLGKSPKSRVKVGGKRIKGQKYGGPLPDWS